MGIVARQGVSNSIIAYLGVLIGALNLLVFFPEFLTEDEFGLTRLIVAVSAIVAQFFSLGSANISLKFFPSFKAAKEKHHGFLSLILLISMSGFLIFVACAFIFEDWVIAKYNDQSSLFGDNYIYFIVYSFFILFYSVIEAYASSLLKTVFSNLLKTIIIRLFWMGLVILYGLKVIQFDTFLFAYVMSYGLILLSLIAYIMYLGEFKLVKIAKEKFQEKSKEIISYGKYSILSSIAGYTANFIDTLMIIGLTTSGLYNIAIYSVAFYIGSMIMIPYAAIGGVASGIVADRMEANDIDAVRNVYTKSVNLLLIISLLFFFGLVLNLDSLLSFMKESYRDGKYVILLIAFTKVYEACTSLNGNIIQFSKYYKYLLVVNSSLIVLAIITNLILIPPYGIEGAALATLITMCAVNTARVIILKVKLDIDSFNMKSLLIVGISVVSYLLIYMIPKLDNTLVDMAVRSVLYTGVFLGTIYYSKVSEDFGKLIDTILIRLRIK